MTYSLLILTLVNMVNYIDRYIMASVGPEVQKVFSLSDFELGLLMSAFMIGYMLTSPIFGQMGDKGNRPRLMAIGVLIWSVATVGSGMAVGFMSLILTRILVGVGEASYGTISPSFIRDSAVDEADANRKFAFFYIALPIGAAIGFIAGGAIAKAYSWQTAFYVAGAPGILLSLLIWKLPEAAARTAPEARQKPSMAQMLADIKKVWAIENYRGVVIGYTLYTFAMGVVAAWAPKYGVAVLGVELHEIDFGVGAVTLVAAALGTLLGGKLGQVFVGRGLTVEGFSMFSGIVTLMSVPFAVAAFCVSDMYSFLGMIFLCEFFMFAATAPVNTAILASAPAAMAATSMALSIFVIHAFGDLISPPLVGLMSDHMTLQVAMMILPAAAFVSGIVWIRVAGQGFQRSPFSKESYPMGPFVIGMARFSQWFFRRTIKIFFREVTVLRSGEGQHAVKVKSPELRDDVPTLLIANHPNAILDAVLVYVTARQTLRAVAKNTLWNIPILRPMLKLAGAVPIARKVDAHEKVDTSAMKHESNDEAMMEVAKSLRMNSFVIYPEGMSHNAPAMVNFRTGGARMLLLGAKLAKADGAGVNIDDGSEFGGDIESSIHFVHKDLDWHEMGFQPVGLYFEEKGRFRSRCVVHYGRRIALKEVFTPDELVRIGNEGPAADLSRKLTERMETELRLLLPEAPDNPSLRNIRQLASLMIDPDTKPKLGERYRWEVMIKSVLDDLNAVPQAERAHGQAMVDQYFANIEAAGISDMTVRDFGRAKNRFSFAAGSWLVAYWIGALLASPFLIAGFFMFYWLNIVIDKLATRLSPDYSELATYKFLGGLMILGAFLLVYMGLITSYLWSAGLGIVSVPTGILIPIVSGYLSLYFRDSLGERWYSLRALMFPWHWSRLRDLSVQRSKAVEFLLGLYEKFL